MPLVFVHGVNVRYNPNNDPFVAARDALFRRSALSQVVADSTRSLIVNPYWGDAAATFPWEHGGLPEGRYEQFGPDNLVAVSLLNDLAAARIVNESNVTHLGGIDPDKVLVTLAEDSFEAAVDALWIVSAENVDQKLAPGFADLAATIAQYVVSNPRPGWIKTARNDQDFVSMLFREAASGSPPPQEHFGIDEVKDVIRQAGERIREGVVRLFDAAGQAAQHAKAEARYQVDEILLRIRTPIHRSVATFLGDIFVYFHQREIGAQPPGREAITSIVSTAFDKAAANRALTGEPIVVVAHSMGGNIVYDLLTSTRNDFNVDVLVTVGSQVAVMEEMKLFTSSDPKIPNANTRKVARPANVKRWVNVFDSTDILGFAAARVFDGVEDYHFVTGHAWAHGGYFVEPMFHERLGSRLKGTR
jgi:hypothetical protein